MKDKRVEFLFKAVEDTQYTVRFLDTKAGVVLLGLSIISSYLGGLIKTLWYLFQALIIVKPNLSIVLGIILGVITVCTFILSAFIVVKAIIPFSSPGKHVIYKGPLPKIPFYLYSTKPKMSFIDLFHEREELKLDYQINEFSALYNDAKEDDLINSLCYELALISYIREKKHYRVWSGILVFQVGIILWLATLVFYEFLNASILPLFPS